MNTQQQKTLLIFALVMALGLVAIETVDLILTMQAEAAGCFGPGFNISKGGCYHPSN
jgi:hypothetical protein